MGQNKSTMSFNTVKKSNREARRHRLQFSRVILLAIFAVIALLILTSLIFAVCLLVNPTSPVDETPPQQTTDPNSDAPQTAPEKLQYELITQSASAVHKGVLINVNYISDSNKHAYVFPETNTQLVNIYDNIAKVSGIEPTYSVGSSAWMLNRETVDAFNQMMLKHYEVSLGDNTVMINSAYRTREEQSSYSTPVGYSDHHTGYCAALRPSNKNGFLKSNHWIYENCHKYGFVIRYPDEKAKITGVDGYEYCIRYVGVAHASYMTANNLCLEEYTDLLAKNYTKDNALEINAADGHQYKVYYVASAGDITTLDVPKNYVYTLSGDNIGGFIVTVHLDEPKNA